MPTIIDEAMRYMGMHSDADEAIRAQLSGLAAVFSSQITPQHIWRVFPLTRAGDQLRLDNIPLPGRSAAKMLAECSQCALMVCTLGAAFDLWLKRLQARDMAQAVMLDALGSAFIESVCDETEREIAQRFPKHYLTDRFSPGYGDLPLTLQPLLLEAAQASRIGVTATDTHLMNPQKSVTALIGIAETPQAARIRGCMYCAMRSSCTLRKAGMTCDL